MEEKRLLKLYVRYNDDNLKKAVDALDENDARFALHYLEGLKNEYSEHIITQIGYIENGDFHIRCETGFTRIK